MAKAKKKNSTKKIVPKFKKGDRVLCSSDLTQELTVLNVFLKTAYSFGHPYEVVKFVLDDNTVRSESDLTFYSLPIQTLAGTVKKLEEEIKSLNLRVK